MKVSKFLKGAAAGLLIALCASQALAVEYRYVRVTTITSLDGSGGDGGDLATCAEMRLSDGGSPISPSGHSATASDEYTGGGEASLVLDANNATNWHSDFDPSTIPHPHWVVYDAGAPIEFDRVLWTNSAGFNGHLEDYNLEGSNNGSDWTDIGGGTAQTGTPASGATVTLMVTASSGGLLLRRRR